MESMLFLRLNRDQSTLLPVSFHPEPKFILLCVINLCSVMICFSVYMKYFRKKESSTKQLITMSNSDKGKILLASDSSSVAI